MQARLSIIIPVLHESETIGATLAGIHRSRGDEKVQIVVADGSPDGSTLRAIRDDRVVGLVCAPGRARQMNAGAARASGEILLFLHADTSLPQDASRLIRRALDPEARGARCGAFSLGLDASTLWLDAVAATANLRTRLTRVPYGDQAQFFTREFFLELGGFADIPIMEDVEIMRRAKRAGHPPVVLPQRATTSARRWREEGALACTLRNWVLAGLYLAGVPPERLARFYPARRT